MKLPFGINECKRGKSGFGFPLLLFLIEDFHRYLYLYALRAAKSEDLRAEKQNRQASCEACRFLERATGIEPAYSAWEADVLPLNYARQKKLRTREASGAGDVT